MSESPSLATLKVRIFADGADLATLRDLAVHPQVAGFTTNPTLMRKARVPEYRRFAQEVLEIVAGRPVSFEVLADDASEIERQAREISSWGDTVYVKVPVTTTRGESLCESVRRLSGDGVRVNVTALLTLTQVEDVSRALAGGAPSYISVFAGRIADTGRDPMPTMTAAAEILRLHRHQHLIWASPRELLNVFQADRAGCEIITVTADLLAKLVLVGKDLDELSLETVQMFHRDAVEAGYSL